MSNAACSHILTAGFVSRGNHLATVDRWGVGGWGLLACRKYARLTHSLIAQAVVPDGRAPCSSPALVESDDMKEAAPALAQDACRGVC